MAVVGGFTYCNPAYSDGSGAMTNEEYIKTCPPMWQRTLRQMAERMDEEFPDNWKITQVKTKFYEPRVYLDVLTRPEEGSGWRERISKIEAWAEIKISGIMEIEDDLAQVTRVTVVNQEGVQFERYDLYQSGVVLLLQDDSRTLKIINREATW